MTQPRRDLFKQLLAMGALPGLIASLGGSAAFASTMDAQRASKINPNIDPKAYDFWSTFANTTARPSLAGRKTRGGGEATAASPDDVQPVFLHYGPDGFKNAAELSPENLIGDGHVMVSVNASTARIGSKDQKTFERLQNAQLRVDIAQKTGIIPAIEAMAYTMVSAMRSVDIQMGTNAALKKTQPTVQNLSTPNDATWQKMQNIPLPDGEGRWALNLEAQRKDSLFCKVLQSVVKEGGQFAPVLGLPGIVMSALQSFNTLYGALHSKAVPVIQSPQLRVFATQKAFQNTGGTGAASGILLQGGTYILIPANQLPPMDQLNKFVILQGRVVPPGTQQVALNEAAADTLKDVTYVTFDVGVTPTTLFDSPSKKSA